MVKVSFGFVTFLIGFAILGFVVSTIGVREIGRAFLQFPLWGIIPLLALTVLVHLISAIKWQYILRSMNIRVPLAMVFKIGLIGYATSYLTPIVYIGGEFFRGYILRDRYGISWQKALSSIFIDKAVEAAVWISMILTGVIFFLYQSGFSFSKIVGASLVAAILITGFLVVVGISSFKKKSIIHLILLRPFKLEGSSVGKFVSSTEGDFFAFFSSGNKKNILLTTKLAILKYIVLWVRNIFLIYYLADVFSLQDSIIALGFTYISYMAPIPAAIGAQEGLLSLVFAGIGYDTGTGAVFTFLLRGVEIIMVGAGLFYLARWGLGKFMFHIVKWMKNGTNGSTSSPQAGNGAKLTPLEVRSPRDRQSP